MCSPVSIRGHSHWAKSVVYRSKCGLGRHPIDYRASIEKAEFGAIGDCCKPYWHLLRARYRVISGIVLANNLAMKIVRRFIWVLILISGVAWAEPPSIVAERFHSAQEVLESDQFVGSYTVQLNSVVEKADGSANVTTAMVMAIEVQPGGEKSRHLESLIVNGEDRTEKNREKMEAGADDDGADDEEDEDFLMPFGADAGRFEFGPANAVDGRIEMTFAPAKGHEKDKGISRGLMAWDAGTQDPLWLELDVVRAPKPMKALKVKMEFVRLDEVIFMNRMVTDGRVKVLLMKRNFHMEMTFSDLVIE